MLINEDVELEDPRKFWLDELQNTKVLLNEVDKAIYALTTDMTASGGVQSYTLNTGQDSQSVTRADLGNLYARRTELLQLIDDLERKLGLHGGAARIIIPSF